MTGKGAKSSGLGSFVSNVRHFVTSTQGLPFTLILTLLCIAFVLFRMKGIEQDYQYNKINKQVDTASIENAELKAKRARLLSTQNLQQLAEKHHMREPRQDQVIVVP